ncbi:MAG: alpha/beta hydrolase [Deltaproteobacteria bacterium]|nr:MAG: alpha/beta hydrolase [Deltaproteobacteria bacterium]
MTMAKSTATSEIHTTRKKPFAPAPVIVLCLALLSLGSGCRRETAPPEEITMDHPDILNILFHPRQEPRTPLPPLAADIDIEVAADAHIGCRLFTTGETAPNNAPTLLFYHGNGEIVTDYDEIGAVYTGQGFNFLVTDYRGYGWSTGTPAATTLLTDANHLYSELTSRLRQQGYTGPFFIMGRSLGSACAIDVAFNHENDEHLCGLILDSAFAETLPLARTLGLDLESLGITEEQTFNNLKKIEQFKKPLLLIHGQEDTLIPLWQAQKLHSYAGPKNKELQIVPGAGHNTLIATAGMMYFEVIKRWIDKLTGAADWRNRRKKFKQQQQR